MNTLVIEFDDAFDIDALLKFLEQCNCSVKTDVKTIHIPVLSLASSEPIAEPLNQDEVENAPNEGAPIEVLLPELPDEPEVPYESPVECEDACVGTCTILDLSVDLPFCVSSETEVNKLAVKGLTTTANQTSFEIGEMSYVMPSQSHLRLSVKIGEDVLSCEFVLTDCADEESCVVFAKTFYDQLTNMGDGSEVPAQ